MKRSFKILLNQLYHELSYNISEIHKCEELHREAVSMNDCAEAVYYDMRASLLAEEGERISITIREIEKRVS